MRKLVSLATLAIVLSATQPAVAGSDVGSVRNFGPELRPAGPTPAATTIATGFGGRSAFGRDDAGNTFVSASCPGRVTKSAPAGAAPPFACPVQLAPRAGESPGFGASGLAFDRNE